MVTDSLLPPAMHTRGFWKFKSIIWLSCNEPDFQDQKKWSYYVLCGHVPQRWPERLKTVPVCCQQLPLCALVTPWRQLVASVFATPPTENSRAEFTYGLLKLVSSSFLMYIRFFFFWVKILYSETKYYSLLKTLIVKLQIALDGWEKGWLYHFHLSRPGYSLTSHPRHGVPPNASHLTCNSTLQAQLQGGGRAE